MQAQFHSHTDNTDSCQTVYEDCSALKFLKTTIFCEPFFPAQEAETKKNPNPMVLTEIIPSGLAVWDMEQRCQDDAMILRSKIHCSQCFRLN